MPTSLLFSAITLIVFPSLIRAQPERWKRLFVWLMNRAGHHQTFLPSPQPCLHPIPMLTKTNTVFTEVRTSAKVPHVWQQHCFNIPFQDIKRIKFPLYVLLIYYSLLFQIFSPFWPHYTFCLNTWWFLITYQSTALMYFKCRLVNVISVIDIGEQNSEEVKQLVSDCTCSQ